MQQLLNLLKRYPGIAIDIIFITGALNFLIQYFYSYVPTGPNALFFLVPLLQAVILALAAALQRESDLERRYKQVIISTLFVICVGPIFYVAVVFFGIKPNIGFIIKGTYILGLMFVTFFIAEAYYKNMTGTTAKLTQNKFAKKTRGFIAFFHSRQLLTTVLLLFLLPFYWQLLQQQMGFNVSSTSFIDYFNQIFYSGKFFLMFYFLAYRILLLLRPPYTYLEMATAIAGFLSFIGIIRF